MYEYWFGYGPPQALAALLRAMGNALEQLARRLEHHRVPPRRRPDCGPDDVHAEAGAPEGASEARPSFTLIEGGQRQRTLAGRSARRVIELPATGWDAPAGAHRLVEELVLASMLAFFGYGLLRLLTLA